MKKWKKLLLMCTVILAAGMLSACGTRNKNNTADDTKTNTTENGTLNNNETNGTTNNGVTNGGTTGAAENGVTENGVTENGVNNTTTGEHTGGLIEDTGEVLQEGVNDVERGVDNVIDGNKTTTTETITGERTTDGKVVE